MAQQTRRNRRRIRLDREVYADPSGVCAVTIAARGRKPLFSDPALAEDALGILKGRCVEAKVPLYAYCLMPDHVHLVLGPSADCDLITFVAQFKNLVQRAARRTGLVGRIWQPRFWDHFLRTNEDLATTVKYVLANPVRAGLVREWHDYPYSGSFVFGDLQEDNP